MPDFNPVCKNELIRRRIECWKKSENEAAQWFLARHDAVLLAKNYRVKQGELDLIFEETLGPGRVELVFVEVRTRSPESWVSALESVTYSKRLRLTRAIRAYLARYRGRAQSLRLDILARDGVCEWTEIRNVELEPGSY